MNALMKIIPAACLAGVISMPVAIMAETGSQPPPQRIREIAAILDATPRGLGTPVSDREFWENISTEPGFLHAVKDASVLAVAAIPELPDSLFLQFSRFGNRTNYEAPYFNRRVTLGRLVLAECIENHGRFLPIIERYIRFICSEPTWILPAHDRDLKNFRGESVQIDLFVAETSWTLATVDHLLKDRLSREIRLLIRKEIQRRTFNPVLRILRDGEPAASWMTVTNNWNAVCFGGVVGAALALIESRDERAWFVYGAEAYTANFFEGFTSDGYCSEGLNYWNYGFGHYLMLSAAVSLASGGKLDFLDRKKAENIARFPDNLEILPGVYPAFADCSVDATPNPRFIRFLEKRFGFHKARTAYSPNASFGRHFYELALFELTRDFWVSTNQLGTGDLSPIRSWFEEAGILICRPPSDMKDGLGVAL